MSTPAPTPTATPTPTPGSSATPTDEYVLQWAYFFFSWWSFFGSILTILAWYALSSNRRSQSATVVRNLSSMTLLYSIALFFANPADYAACQLQAWLITIALASMYIWVIILIYVEFTILFGHSGIESQFTSVRFLLIVYTPVLILALIPAACSSYGNTSSGRCWIDIGSTYGFGVRHAFFFLEAIGLIIILSAYLRILYLASVKLRKTHKILKESYRKAMRAHFRFLTIPFIYFLCFIWQPLIHLEQWISNQKSDSTSSLTLRYLNSFLNPVFGFLVFLLFIYADRYKHLYKLKKYLSMLLSRSAKTVQAIPPDVIEESCDSEAGYVKQREAEMKAVELAKKKEFDDERSDNDLSPLPSAAMQRASSAVTSGTGSTGSTEQKHFRLKSVARLTRLSVSLESRNSGCEPGIPSNSLVRSDTVDVSVADASSDKTVKGSPPQSTQSQKSSLHSVDKAAAHRPPAVSIPVDFALLNAKVKSANSSEVVLPRKAPLTTPASLSATKEATDSKTSPLMSAATPQLRKTVTFSN